MLSRRGFLKGIAAGITLATPVARAIADMPANTIVYTPRIISDPDTLDAGLFYINRDARVIGFTEAGAKRGVTVQELYSYLKDAWKDDLDLMAEPFPTMAITPEYLQMQYDWSIDWSRAEAVTCGMIEECNGDKYASMIGLGTWDSGDLQLKRNDLPKTEMVDQNSHVVRLQPGTESLSWWSNREPELGAPSTGRWKLSADNAKMTTENLGYTNIFEQACGSIRFPKPVGHQWIPELI